MNHSSIISLDYYRVCRETVGRVVYFEATIEDIVQVSCATRWDPAEFGSARCTGELLLEDDEKTPESFDDFKALAELVETWNPVLDEY